MNCLTSGCYPGKWPRNISAFYNPIGVQADFANARHGDSWVTPPLRYKLSVFNYMQEIQLTTADLIKSSQQFGLTPRLILLGGQNAPPNLRHGIIITIIVLISRRTDFHVKGTVLLDSLAACPSFPLVADFRILAAALPYQDGYVQLPGCEHVTYRICTYHARLDLQPTSYRIGFLWWKSDGCEIWRGHLPQAWPHAVHIDMQPARPSE